MLSNTISQSSDRTSNEENHHGVKVSVRSVTLIEDNDHGSWHKKSEKKEQSEVFQAGTYSFIN